MNSVVKMSVKRSMYSYFCIYLRPALKVFTFYANKVKPTFRRIMHLSIFCPPGGAAGIHGALDRRPFLRGGNLINLWNPGPG